MGDRVYKIKLLPSVLQFAENEALNSVENLIPYLKNEGRKLSDEKRTKLLLQIDYCLLCLHKGNTVCSLPADSQISKLKSLNLDILNDPTGAETDDIKSLEKVYCCTLTGGKKHAFAEGITLNDIVYTDRGIALDILEKLANEKDPPTIDAVLEHPFHWSDFNKVYFICRATEHLNNALKKYRQYPKQQILRNYKMGNEVSVVSQAGWIEQLKLSEQDLMRIESESCAECGPVGRKTIYDLAVVPQATKGDREKSVFELARFFRNRYTHFPEDGEKVHLCFGDYPYGYFKFFSKRFPTFFTHVYNNMKSYVFAYENLDKFAKLESFSMSLYTPFKISRLDPDREGATELS